MRPRGATGKNLEGGVGQIRGEGLNYELVVSFWAGGFNKGLLIVGVGIFSGLINLSILTSLKPWWLDAFLGAALVVC
jgi:hypothetical protein